MDRFLLVCGTLSAGLHAVALVQMPHLGSREGARSGEMAVRFLSSPGETAVAFVPEGLRARDGAAMRGSSILAAETDAGESPAGDVVEEIRGTGEIVRGIVQESLRPLLEEDAAASGAFSEALAMYKARLEKILGSESRLSYPAGELREGREAKLFLRFSLRPDGSVESVEVPPGCGGFGGELAAGLRKASGHFPPFPDKVTCGKLVFSWPVHFNMN